MDGDTLMSILKIEYRTPRSLYSMIDYSKDKEKTSTEGLFAIGCNPLKAEQEMQFVQDIYFRDNITHQYVQVIFAFDIDINLPLTFIREVCFQIGQILILDKRQLFGAIHYLGKDSHKVHCHYLINYVGIDGSLYKQHYSLHYYKNKVNEILFLYGLNPIKMFAPDNF